MKSLLLTLVLAISALASAQTTLYSNDFEGTPGFTLNSTDMGATAAGDNPWIINNIYTGGSGSFYCPALGFNFPFTVPAAPNQPAGITNNPTSTYLHVTPQIAIDGGGTLPAASYVAADGFCIFGGQTTFTKMSNDISTVGYSSVDLDFWWACGGSAGYYGQVYYSTDGGSSWTAVTCPTTGTTNWSGVLNWTNTTLNDPAWAEQSTLRFAFSFYSSTTSTGNEADPGFAIDDINIIGGTACTSTTSSITETACIQYQSPAGNTYTTTGMYYDTIPNAAGCDSIITIDLTVNQVDVNVTQAGVTLVSSASGAAYQWLDCNNNYAQLNGETGQIYTATNNGSYAVEVTQNGCTDTSTCYTVNSAGVEDISSTIFDLYPNPATDHLTIVSSSAIKMVRVYNSLGQVMLTDTDNELNIESLKRGVYIIDVTTENDVITRRFLKK